MTKKFNTDRTKVNKQLGVRKAEHSVLCWLSNFFSKFSSKYSAQFWCSVFHLQTACFSSSLPLYKAPSTKPNAFQSFSNYLVIPNYIKLLSLLRVLHETQLLLKGKVRTLKKQQIKLRNSWKFLPLLSGYAYFFPRISV